MKNEINNKIIKNEINNEKMKILIDKRLSDSYISGFVQGDGSFSVNLSVKKNNKGIRIYLNPIFILTQHNNNILLIKKIIERFKNIGTYSIDNNNIIRYRVSNLHDIKNIIIPFFDKYQLKDNKLLSFIKFKFIVNKLLELENKQKGINLDLEKKYDRLYLDLIAISNNMNPLVKPSVQLQLMNKTYQDIILNNKLSNNILNELNNLINNFNYENNLNIDFINGLFDSDGWITIGIKLNKQNNLSLVIVYGIVSDTFNSKLLDNIKDYFNNIGTIYKRKDERSISYLINKTKILSGILPKIYNISDYKDILINYKDINNIYSIGPIIKDYKIINILKILDLELKFNQTKRKNERIKILNNILILSYENRSNSLRNKENLNSYLIRMQEKLHVLYI